MCKKCGEPVVDRQMCRKHYNEHMAKYMTDRYHRRRDEFIQSRGGRCEQCNRTDGLEIDHIDPSLKSFDIGKVLSGGAESRIQKELSKCQVLCGSCHKHKSAAAYKDQTHCKHGHLYEGENLGRDSRGNRFCKYCRYRHNAVRAGRQPRSFDSWMQG